MNRIVIIGSSAAAKSAAETLLLKGKGDEKITIITRDKYYFYSRVLLPNYITGEIDEKELSFVEEDLLQSGNINVVNGKAESLDVEKKLVKVEDYENIEYDKLIIATGASPSENDTKHGEIDGIFGLRDFEDAVAIKKRALNVQECIVIGGGLVSLKSAWALNELGKKVTIIVTSKQLLSSTMDIYGAGIVKNTLEKQGIKVILDAGVEQFLSKEGQVSGVKLKDGEIIEGKLIVVGKGVKPNLTIVNNADIKTDSGILVNERMETNVKDIYAAGDVAQSKDLLRGSTTNFTLWPDAIAQGKIAALNILGINKEYTGGISMNSVVFYNTPLISMGLVKERDIRGCDVYENKDISKGIYRKIVIRNRRIVGAICAGDVSFAGMIHWDIKSGKTIEEPEMYLTKHGLEDIYISRNNN